MPQPDDPVVFDGSLQLTFKDLRKGMLYDRRNQILEEKLIGRNVSKHYL